MIIFIIPSFTLGGVETQTYNLCREFISQGYRVGVVVTRGGKGPLFGKLEKLGVECHFFNEFNGFSRFPFFKKFRVLFRFVFFLRSLKPTVLIPFTEPINIAVNAVWRFTGAKKCFFTMRGGTPIGGSFTRLFPLVRILKPTAFVSNSQNGARVMEDFLKLKPGLFKVIPNGVFLNPPLNSSEFWRTMLDIDASDYVFIMIGNYYPEKNHEVLLRAFHSLVTNHHPVRAKLILCGDKSNFDRQYLYIKSLILDLKLYGRVRLIESTNDISGLLKIAHCGILLSYSEGCPNAVLEYMMAGIPFLGSDIPAIREVVPENYPFLVSNEDAVEVEDKLLQISSLSTEEAQALRTALSQRVNSNYNYSNLVNSWKELIHS
jgi:glycosyltransferase involved in cell wall biosynthesis